ncbi:unnamed protein product [Prunus armeniaca]|uniref:Subtilisin-like protease fibronectin type-III domain-containing protein n=1 Tax=Prunus armeniaca TaxID=36596 RepID=A0A6J5XQS5_PRUAR|nr:unnamed protein product [Prunus armeniaca]
MATPHVSWSAAAIRSALMTTANPVDNSKRPIRDQGFNFTVASPLAMGDGQVDPNRALDPVSPERLVFSNKYEKQNYTLRIEHMSSDEQVVSFGDIVWVEKSGKYVRSPIVVSPVFAFG